MVADLAFGTFLISGENEPPLPPIYAFPRGFLCQSVSCKLYVLLCVMWYVPHFQAFSYNFLLILANPTGWSCSRPIHERWNPPEGLGPLMNVEMKNIDYIFHFAATIRHLELYL